VITKPMEKITLNTPVSHLKGIGRRYEQALKDAGIEQVKDFLFYFPFRYDDYSKITLIKNLKLGEKVTIEGKIKDVEKKATFRRRMSIIEALVEDKTGSMRLIWFNQPFLKNSLRKGQTYRFSGKTDFNKGYLTINNPTFEKTNTKAVNTGRLLPVYHENSTLTSRWLRKQVFPLLYLSKKIPETLPQPLLKEYDLMTLPEAITEVHFPLSEKSKDASRYRLAFEELFLIQLHLGKQRLKWKKHTAPKIPIDLKNVRSFVKKLPFKLTDAQRKSAWEIIQDLSKTHPMNRLLEGDVGAGKTVVAAIAALVTAKKDYQTVFLAPTEILAEQHFKTLKEFLGKFTSQSEIGLFTRSQSRTAYKKLQRKEFLKKLKEGKIKIISGTHALLQTDVEFSNLGLVIIDEQHRFGVEQRAHLQKEIRKKSKNTPHLLSMSATPIPRTLALAVYGDLELSIVNELPKGRQEILTRIITPARRDQMYEFIKKEVEKGRQIFVICPLIEEQNKEELDYFSKDYWEKRQQIEVKAAVHEQKNLKKNIFPKFKIGLLHGKLKSKEKEKVMDEFKKGKIDILVSTSVVEVGVDIPNATVMLIEGAERFGLAQLHQFRGRVGRGKHQSYCFLSLSEGGVTANRRLNALVKCSDGFALAEKDLAIRGPGEFIGTRQSGLPDLTMASLSDTNLISTTSQAAKNILKKSSNLNKYPILEKRLESFRKHYHGE